MTAEQARAAVKELGEFVMAHPFANCVVLTFVKYDAGARSGKFHSYKYLTLPVSVYDEIKHELK